MRLPVINHKAYIAILVVTAVIFLTIPLIHIIPSISTGNKKIISIDVLDNTIPVYYIGNDYRIISSFQNIIVNPSQSETSQLHITILDLRYVDINSALELMRSEFHSNSPYILIGTPEAINELITHQKPALFSSSIGMVHGVKGKSMNTTSNIIIYGYISLSEGTSITISIIDITDDTSTFIQGIHEVYTRLALNLNMLNNPSNPHISTNKTFSYHELTGKLNQKL